MKPKLLIFVTFASLILATLFWWFSSAQVLKRRTTELLECVEMEKGTGRIERAYKAEKLRDLIDDTITISYPTMSDAFSHTYATNEPITLPEQRAKTALLYLTETADWISVNNQTIQVVNHNKTTAKVRAHFDLSTKLKNRSQSDVSLEATLHFARVKNRWLLREASFTQ
ncbi:hypothetical protein [Rubritalea tangerina]|uniref:SnoaL-like domain-containing protein n=1 Tax=Rubritalea tangerina TaxID=430798 RepID=A0ABW4Z817_9BACT